MGRRMDILGQMDQNLHLEIIQLNIHGTTPVSIQSIDHVVSDSELDMSLVEGDQQVTEYDDMYDDDRPTELT